MSEYRWRVVKAWIGVVRRIKDERGLFQDDKLLGVILRSGVVQACGHFCSVTVSVGGKKYMASGAEDRIYPFHSIKLENGEPTPKLELEAMGWCKDGNTYAFKNDKGEIVKLVKAGKSPDNTLGIPRDNWPEMLVEPERKVAWKETKPGVFERQY